MAERRQMELIGELKQISSVVNKKTGKESKYIKLLVSTPFDDDMQIELITISGEIEDPTCAKNDMLGKVYKCRVMQVAGPERFYWNLIKAERVGVNGARPKVI